jgi:predicted dehydrogenase/NADPH:quinone reductase-like Zn-dependent oxidoreductase
MQQLLHDFRSGKVIVAEVPRPEVGPNEVLVRNRFSAVSPGTERAVIESRSRNVVKTALKRKDLVRRVLAKAKRDGLLATVRAVGRKLDASLPLGYSSAGTVVTVGSDVTDLRPGDRVACAGAGFACHAEYVCVPRMLCAPVPEAVEDATAAFTTLGAIAVQGVRQAEPQFGETVAVIGLGIMGLLTAQIVTAAGARCIGMDISADRVESFRKLCNGEGLVVEPGVEERVFALTDDIGADRVIIAAASRENAVIELAAAICRDRARIVVVGDVAMNLPRAPFYEKELELRLSRSYGPGRYDAVYEKGGLDYPIGYVRWTENRNMQEFLRLAAKGAVRPLEMVTERVKIQDAPAAYESISAGGAPLGLLLEYPAESATAEARRVELTPGAPKTGEVGVAVVGAGNFVRSVLLPAIAGAPGARLTGIASARGVNARDLGMKFKCEFCATGLDELLSHSGVDAVFICTPHNLHADQAIACLEAGKAVYLEKPLCIEEADVERVVSAARASGRPLFVGYNRRFAPMTEQLRQAFAGRRTPLAIHYRVNAGTIDPNSWIVDRERGGGRIVGEVCHFVDLAKWIVGRPVREVATFRTGESADDAVCLMHFDDGSVASVTYVTSGPASLSKERIEVIGARRAVVIEDFRGLTTWEGQRTDQKSAAQDKGHAAAVRRFIACVKGSAENPFSLEDLADTSRITFRMRGDAGGE